MEVGNTIYFFRDNAEYGFLSQWYPSYFVSGKNTYQNAEQYMMAEKARLFGDEAVRRKILAESDPKKIKALGRKISGFDESVWASSREAIFYQGNKLKFSQNDFLYEALMSTGNKVLAEASPYDTVWGIGVSARKGLKKSDWKGLNLLGEVLMKVREDLRPKRHGGSATKKTIRASSSNANTATKRRRMAKDEEEENSSSSLESSSGSDSESGSSILLLSDSDSE
jgi:ribA/ribD-fused uncharacterized protein